MCAVSRATNLINSNPNCDRHDLPILWSRIKLSRVGQCLLQFRAEFTDPHFCQVHRSLLSTLELSCRMQDRIHQDVDVGDDCDYKLFGTDDQNAEIVSDYL